jgi:hypothetical protein
MPGGEQKNLRKRYEGLLPSIFRAGYILGPRCLSSLDKGSPALSALLTPSPPAEFSFNMQPSWPARDHGRPVPSRDSQTPSRCISLATFYLIPHWQPKFSYWGSCLWRIVGLQADVKCSPDNGSFLLFLQIFIPRRSWASPGSQRKRTPKEPFPARPFTPHQPEAGDCRKP